MTENAFIPDLQFKYSKDFQPFYFSDRKNMVRIAMEYVKSSRLPGDYLEFGVHKGATFQAAFHFAQREEQSGMTFYAFDSFAGMPKSEGIDSIDAFHQFSEGQYACTEAEFKNAIKNNGSTWKRLSPLPAGLTRP